MDIQNTFQGTYRMRRVLTFYRPTAMFFNPIEHVSINVEDATSIDASEVLVVFRYFSQQNCNASNIKSR